MEGRAGCFALFVFVVSRDCCMALPHDGTVLLYADHTHLLFLLVTNASPIFETYHCLYQELRNQLGYLQRHDPFELVHYNIDQRPGNPLVACGDFGLPDSLNN